MIRKLFKACIAICSATLCMGLVSCEFFDDTDEIAPGLEPLPSEQEYSSEIVNPDYVNINWDSIDLIKCDPDNGAFEFSSTSVTEKLRPGNVLTIDADTTGYLVIVENVKWKNDTVQVKTRQGSMCDIFANTSFTLATSESEATSATRASGKKVYTPTKIVYRDDNGNVFTQSLTRGDVLRGRLIDESINFDGLEFYTDKKTNTKVYMKEANMGFTLDMVMNLSFGARTKKDVEDQAWAQYRSEALDVSAVLEGNVNSNFILQADISGKVKYPRNQEEKDIKFKSNIINTSVEFLVGTVPVWVTFNVDAYRGASIEAEGSMSAYTGYKSKIKSELGFGWNQANNSIYPIRKYEETDTVIPPTIEGKGSITAKAWIYPRFHVSLYNIVGPSFDIKPYIGSQLSGGFRQTMDTSPNDYCAWSLRNFVGLNFKAGLSLKFMNYDERFIETEDIPIFEKDIFRSPTDICVYDVSTDEIQAAQPVDATFAVYDTDFLFKETYLTKLPQVVKFESNGTLSTNYDMAENGLVSVRWTPSSEKDVLRAVLYDVDGNVIKEACIGAVEAVDLGLSVKWASCNLDASKPEELGGWYAWGEVSPRNPAYYDHNSYNEPPYDCISGTEYDAATERLGKRWRMPTVDEFCELKIRCDITEVSQNNVLGQLFTSRINGNSIFLPYTAATHHDYSDIGDAKDKPVGLYWTGEMGYANEYEKYMKEIWIRITHDCSCSPFIICYGDGCCLYQIRPVVNE